MKWRELMLDPLEEFHLPPHLTMQDLEKAFRVINQAWEKDSDRILAPRSLKHLTAKEWEVAGMMLSVLILQKEESQLH
jgi:hypothetical protein